MSTEPKSASSDSKPNGGGRKKHWHGTSRPYLISRLRAAGRVDLVAAVESGKVSAYACGVEMGWIKRRPVLGTGSLNAARQRRFQFDHLGFRGPDPGPESDGQAALSARDAALCQELWLGSAAGGSFFSTREELHDAWIRLRDVVMGEWARDGRRPMGWWQFEAPELGLKYPGDERERSALWEAGIIVGEERCDLERHWKQEFEDAFSRHDAKARRQCFRDADIPHELIREWMEERHRRAHSSLLHCPRHNQPIGLQRNQRGLPS